MVKRYAHLSEVHTAGVVEKMNKKIFAGGVMVTDTNRYDVKKSFRINEAAKL